MREGDKTTAGGNVLEGVPNNMHHGVRLSYEGARIYCPACNSEGYASKVPPYPPYLPMKMMGKAPILDGDLCVCKCDPPPRLIEAQHDRFMSFESDPQSVARIAPDRTPLRAVGVFDEQFRLIDHDTGRPLANVRYRVRTATGGGFAGVTDAAGHTQRITTTDSENLRLEISHDHV
ncbi:PAAR domain-containing protein [Burkholderia sp. 4701]|nr:PAAR domain-containing protein [Burkholderia sp. 4701]MXN85097.1 PAAR domain-containing protein [Burkholderia sp. 4812]